MDDGDKQKGASEATTLEPDAAPLRAYLTLAQAAALLGVQPATLSQQALAGKLQTARLGRMYVTTHAWLDAYRARYLGQRGSAEEVDAQDRYNRRFTTLLGLDRKRTQEAITRASVEAGVDTLFRYPDITPARLREIVALQRKTVLRRETDAARMAAATAIVDAVFASPGVDAAQYAAQREAAQRSPSALGIRWRAVFFDAIATTEEDVTPQNLGVIARLDQQVAETLAQQLLGRDPPMSVHECRAHLMQAMLEGSLNLPEDSRDCRDMIEHTVERGMRQAIRALGARRAAAGQATPESA
jgi:hypothetical protein